MGIIIATAKDAAANSYVTIAEMIAHLGTSRLYTTKFDLASTKTPDAEGYLVNNGPGYNPGDTAIVVDAGTGALASGEFVKFGGHVTEYELGAALSAPGTMTLAAPGLLTAVIDDEVIERRTANQREKALIWFTWFLDRTWDYEGSPTTSAQRLRMPRSGLVDEDNILIDQDTIPEALKIATIEGSLAFMERNRIKDPAVLGIGLNTGRIGPMRGEINSAQVLQFIPSDIVAMLRPFGSPAPSTFRGSAVLPLKRS